MAFSCFKCDWNILEGKGFWDLISVFEPYLATSVPFEELYQAFWAISDYKWLRLQLRWRIIQAKLISNPNIWNNSMNENIKSLFHKARTQCSRSDLTAIGLVVPVTQSDSIQCLNFVKKWLIQYLIQYCLNQDSILNIIQLKKYLMIQFQKWLNSIVKASLLRVE